MKINVLDIDSFENHLFRVDEGESFLNLVDSINKNGLLVPITVRKKQNDRYEVLSGHRRLKAFVKLEIKEIECDIKVMSDEEAIIYMVDSNLYRDKLLPSEKAFAYKMKTDVIKHQGKKTSTHVVSKLRSAELIGKEYKESRENIRRYIRLTYLIPKLLELIDNTVLYDKRYYLTMGLTIGVELSYLNKEEQELLYNTITYADATPSLGQAKRIRKLSEERKLCFNILEQMLDEKKGIQNETISFNKSKIEEALPKEILKRNKVYIERYIIEAIKQYKV